MKLTRKNKLHQNLKNNKKYTRTYKLIGGADADAEQEKKLMVKRPQKMSEMWSKRKEKEEQQEEQLNTLMEKIREMDNEPSRYKIPAILNNNSSSDTQDNININISDNIAIFFDEANKIKLRKDIIKN